MSDILKRAIEKAVKGGFYIGQYYPGLEGGKDAMQNYLYSIKERIIFSHDFAKAFWGEAEVCCFCGVGFPHMPDCLYGKNEPSPCVLFAWQFHLQQMVLEENPLEYLGRFL